MNFEFGENLTCELRNHLASENRRENRTQSRRTISGCRRPQGSSGIGQNQRPRYVYKLDSEKTEARFTVRSYIRPSIAHETISVPSRLKLTAVTGSE